jgi:hypothetical protein
MDLNNRRIIINADDCGISKQVNQKIESCIMSGMITSTTIMANMEDFDGAVRLYHQYKDVISFGWHINLTEGQPLTCSQLLLDKGYFKEEEGLLKFNGRAFRNKLIGKDMSDEIHKELLAQYTRLRDSGIVPTHADSHQHIHTTRSMLFIVPSLLKELGVVKCRRLRNYVPASYSRLLRNCWGTWMKTHGLIMTDTFCAFHEYYDMPLLPQGADVELMCHPGHQGEEYREEYELLKKADFDKLKAKLISYKEL